MTVVLYIFWLAALILILFYRIIFSRLASYNTPELQKVNLPVSVVICARDEENNLRQLLPAILKQDYPEFEVVVVNDHSTDGSVDVLRSLQSQYPQLKIIDLTSYPDKGKKAALRMGVQSAKYDHLLLTDADCIPAGNQWIQYMVNGFSERADIVLGYSPYQKSRGMLNGLIRYETFQTAMQYLSYSLSGQTYMGVGRNMAYTKEVFNNAESLDRHANLLTGDDDLLINEVAHKFKVAVQVHPDSWMISKPKATWSDWLHQKRRHLAAGYRYQQVHQMLLGLYLSAYFTFNTLLLVVLLYSPLLAIATYMVKWLLSIDVTIKNARKLGVADMWKSWVLLDFILPQFLVTLGLLSTNKVKEWSKKRKDPIELKKI